MTFQRKHHRAGHIIRMDKRPFNIAGSPNDKWSLPLKCANDERGDYMCSRRVKVVMATVWVGGPDDGDLDAVTFGVDPCLDFTYSFCPSEGVFRWMRITGPCGLVIEHCQRAGINGRT